MELLVSITILSKYVELIVSFAFIIATTLKMIKHRIKTLIYLDIAILVNTVNILTQTIPLLFPDKNIEMWALLFTFSVVFVFSAMIIFFDVYTEEYSLKKTGTALIGVVSITILTIAALVNDDIEILTATLIVDGRPYYRWSDTASLILTPLLLLMGYWAHTITRDSLKNSINEDHARQIRIMRIGFFISIVITALISIPGMLIFFVFDSSYGFIFFIYFLQGLTLTIGLGIVFYGYLSVDQVGFLLPQQLTSLFVIDKSGIPIFKYNFKTTDEDHDVALITGALTAITTLLGEAFGVSSNIKSINFHDTELLLSFRENLAFALLTSKVTNFSKNALERFANRFISKFVKELSEPIGEVSKFDDAASELLAAFGLS